MWGEYPMAAVPGAFTIFFNKRGPRDAAAHGCAEASAKGLTEYQTMKLLKIVSIGAVCTFTLTMARAVHIWEDPGQWSSTTFTYNASAPKYTGNELNLEFFGSYTHPERRIEDLFKTNIRHDGTWGGGVGINYFFLCWLGIGGDITMNDNGGRFVDQALGNLILRIPIMNTGIAPYVFGGGGRLFDPSWEWEGHVGTGIEFRITPGFGMFVDGRYQWPDNTTDRLQFRAGIRIAF